MARVAMLAEARLHPYAACTGDGPQGEEPNCRGEWPSSPFARQAAKDHVVDNPTHRVVVVREVRTVYGVQD